MARRGGFDVRHMPGFATIAAVVFVVLYAPIVLLVVYSFSGADTSGVWGGLSWRWYVAAWSNETVKAATLRSLIVAGIAATVATVVATMAAVATTRSRELRGQGLVLAMINLPLMAPEIVTAVALLLVFALVKISTGYQGLGYVVLAHSAFCIPFAFLPIRGRLQDMDVTLETAAADLYATPARAFRFVTLPLLWPGILAGFMLAFVISLDDVVITNMIAGPGQETLPVYMLGQLRRVISPEINAVSTVVLAASVLFVSLFFVLNRQKGRS